MVEDPGGLAALNFQLFLWGFYGYGKNGFSLCLFIFFHFLEFLLTHEPAGLVAEFSTMFTNWKIKEMRNCNFCVLILSWLQERCLCKTEWPCCCKLLRSSQCISTKATLTSYQINFQWSLSSWHRNIENIQHVYQTSKKLVLPSLLVKASASWWWGGTNSTIYRLSQHMTIEFDLFWGTNSTFYLFSQHMIIVFDVFCAFIIYAYVVRYTRFATMESVAWLQQNYTTDLKG